LSDLSDPVFAGFNGSIKNMLSMLLADTLKTIGAPRKDYSRTPHAWQGLFHRLPLSNMPV